MSDIENFLQACLHTDQTIRSNAEKAITEMRNNNPETLAQGLVSGMALPDEATAGLAAVLYRSNFIEKREFLTKNPAIAQQGKLTINGLISPAKRTILLKKYADVLVGLHEILRTGSEFLALISDTSNSADNNIKELSMYCIELATECPDMMEMLRAEAGYS